MRLRSALTGNLEKFMTDELRTVETAVSRGVRGEGNDVKQDLRADVIQGGLGRKLSKSWRVNHYPGSGASIDATAFVFTKAATLVGAFDKGVTIRSRNGLYLAIPTESAPKKGNGRKRLTPSNFPEHRLGRLRFVYRRSGPSMLVVDNVKVTKSGRVTSNVVRRKSGHYSRLQGRVTVPMFLLYRQTRLKRRLNSTKIMARSERRLAGRIDREFNHLDAGGNR